MAPVAPPAKALVTGANGYIAAWVVRSLLEAGYSVRGTVRSDAKGEHLKKLFASYGGRFEVAIVEHITKDGAFDEAVKGVDLVGHLASPFFLNLKEPNDLIVPAVHGTTSILHSILKYGSSVKRVILLASCACVLQPGVTGKWDESVWNELSIKEIEEKGDKASPTSVYRASKTLAEKAAWKFFEQHQASVGWDLAVLNPPFVFGPPVHEVKTVDMLNTSMLDFFNTVAKGTKSDAELASTGSAWVDVRDVAQAHVLAAQKAEAGGERIITSAGPYYWQEIVDVANSLQPPPITTIAKGEPGATKGKVHVVDYETKKCDRILGIQFRSLEDMVKDILVDFKERGWAQ